MKLPQTGPLAPVDEPHTLIRDAIADLELQEKIPGIVINMGSYHYPRDDGNCHQCLAGAIMSRRLGSGTKTYKSPVRFPEAKFRLFAIDALRTGALREAARLLKQDGCSQHVHEAILGLGNRGITPYDLGSDDFKRDMLELADDIEAAIENHQNPQSEPGPMKTKLENKFLCKKLGQEIPPPDQAMPFARIEPPTLPAHPYESRPLRRRDFRGLEPMPVREIGQEGGAQ